MVLRFKCFWNNIKRTVVLFAHFNLTFTSAPETEFRAKVSSLQRSAAEITPISPPNETRNELLNILE